MKMAVNGAGIIGVTTAYELACDGHVVTVFERRGTAAEETSFANAGIVAPGYVTPWAAPGMPLKVLKHVFSRYAPVKLGLPLSRSELAWMWRWYRACNPGTYLACRTQLQRLAFYTRTRLHQITADRQLDYDRSDGYMVLLRSQSDSDMVLVGIRPTQGGADGHRPTRGTFASLRTRASSAHPKPERKSPVHNEAIHSPAPS